MKDIRDYKKEDFVMYDNVLSIIEKFYTPVHVEHWWGMRHYFDTETRKLYVFLYWQSHILLCNWIMPLQQVDIWRWMVYDSKYIYRDAINKEAEWNRRRYDELEMYYKD